MTPWSLIFGLCLLAISLIALIGFFSDIASRKGFNRGYEVGRHEGKSIHAAECYALGRKDADNWWIGLEDAATEARRKMYMAQQPNPSPNYRSSGPPR